MTADASFVSGLLTSSTVVKTENPPNDVIKSWASPTTATAANAEDKGMSTLTLCYDTNLVLGYYFDYYC